LSVISHELRTPLNFITGFASTLDDEVQGPINPRQHEALGKIHSGADQMLRLVEDLLDLARIQAGQLQVSPEPTPFVPLVTDSLGHLRPLAEQAGIRLHIDMDVPVAPDIEGPRVGQVLTNLVGNAIKFSPPDTTITVRAFVRASRLVVEVEDQGHGIAPEDTSRLFQRFGQLDMSTTRPAGGTGLGLAICKALVEAHAGEIDVRSSGLGQGSTFWFSLPCAL
jgi:signal transduction histidine kinase